MAKQEEKFVSKKDFDSAIGQLTDLVKVLIEQPKEVKPVEKVIEEKSDSNYIPPKWRQIVDEVLGTDFGVNVSYPDTGSGFIFKIIVPLNKSNASKSYLDFYKADVRSKAINNSEGADGVRRYCERVAKNLGIVVKK